jgi:hypothetical protein
VPNVPSHGKLRTHDGRTVRIQELTLHEGLELWYRYCDPDTWGMDLAAGTLASGLAILRLGLKCVLNDRDVQAVELGEARLRCYQDHLFEANKFKYPPLGTPLKTQHDGTDLYAWVAKTLGYTSKQKKRTTPGSTVMTIPPTNVPYNLKIDMTPEAYEQVCFFSVFLFFFDLSCLILRFFFFFFGVSFYVYVFVNQYLSDQGLLVKYVPVLTAACTVL